MNVWTSHTIAMLTFVCDGLANKANYLLFPINQIFSLQLTGHL